MFGRGWIAEQLELAVADDHPWNRPPDQSVLQDNPRIPPWRWANFHPLAAYWTDVDESAAPELTTWEWWIVSVYRYLAGDAPHAPSEMAQLLDDEGIDDPAIRAEVRSAWRILDEETALWRQELEEYAMRPKGNA